MKKGQVALGLLGLGNRSTLFYIDQLNKCFNSSQGNYSTCPFKLLNVNFNDVNPYLPNNFSKLKIQLLKYVAEIEKLEIDLLLIPNITLHEAWGQLNSNIAIVHPILKTIDVLKKKEELEVVVFGSKYSMEALYLQNLFNSNQIKVIQPKEDEKLFLDELRKLIYANKETLHDLEKYNTLLKSYLKNRAIIISCTELSIPLTDNELNVYDMARIQIQNAVDQLIK